MPRKMGETEMDWGKHKKKMGVMLFILGILVLINAQWSVVSWSIFVGLMIALAGLVKLIMPVK